MIDPAAACDSFIVEIVHARATIGHIAFVFQRLESYLVIDTTLQIQAKILEIKYSLPYGFVHEHKHGD